jgi:hypothetical protein
MSEAKLWGVLAQYENPAVLTHACERVRDEGYQAWDACTPFPVHGLEKAMGVKPSRLPWYVLIVGIMGSAFMLWFEVYAMSDLYPFIVGGKPLFSLPAFVPAWYEITVLSSCLTAFFGNWVLSGLPRPHHDRGEGLQVRSRAHQGAAPGHRRHLGRRAGGLKCCV